jgi:hypothetical protein
MSPPFTRLVRLKSLFLNADIMTRRIVDRRAQSHCRNAYLVPPDTDSANNASELKTRSVEQFGFEHSDSGEWGR